MRAHKRIGIGGIERKGGWQKRGKWDKAEGDHNGTSKHLIKRLNAKYAPSVR